MNREGSHREGLQNYKATHEERKMVSNNESNLDNRGSLYNDRGGSGYKGGSYRQSSLDDYRRGRSRSRRDNYDNNRSELLVRRYHSLYCHNTE